MTSHQVKQWLTEYPAMRERRAKNKWLGALILKQHGIELTPILKDKMDDIVSEILSADRQYRKAMEDHPELRGSDYADGERLSQEYQLGLGYAPNYHNDTKLHEKIS